MNFPRQKWIFPARKIFNKKTQGHDDVELVTITEGLC
jgi:hypothetical protein